jgi:DNA invertase Pin-like site-specific DNA recombinase
MHNAGMIYGYARVSTDAQDLTSQLAQLRAAGCEKIFREKIIGAIADRPQLKKLTAGLTHGDVVVIPAVGPCRCRPGLVAIESRCNSTSMRHKITLAG